MSKCGIFNNFTKVCEVDDGKGMCRHRNDCDVLPILKLLAEAKAVDPPEVKPDEYHRGLEQVTFWIRR